MKARNPSQPSTLLGHSRTRPVPSMSAITIPGAFHNNAPALQSPSSGNSSDTTSSPKTPPASSFANCKQEYGPHNSQDDGQHIGFPDFEIVRSLKCNEEEVKPDIIANIDRNIFFKEERWTCYRRNYLFVQCSYNLSPCIPGAPVYVETDHGRKMVQAFGVKLAAVMDAERDGKTVGLIQQTPKRDRGPQMEVKVEKLAPSQPGETPMAYTTGGTSPNSPYLPLQADETSKASTPPTGTHTFERIQFKSATANNGRRRAQQQYFYLRVELYADTRSSADAGEEWTKIAHRASEPMVVRGRSPGHYKDSPTTPGTSHGGAGGGYGPTGYTYGGTGSSISHSLPSSASTRGSMSSAVGGGTSYFNQPHTVPSTPGWASSGSMSMKSPTALPEYKNNDFMNMNEQEAHDFDSVEGYRWFPFAAANTPSQGMPRAALKYDNVANNESSGFATANSPSWTQYGPACSRFQGLETSQGYYTDVKAGF